MVRIFHGLSLIAAIGNYCKSSSLILWGLEPHSRELTFTQTIAV